MNSQSYNQVNSKWYSSCQNKCLFSLLIFTLNTVSVFNSKEAEWRIYASMNYGNIGSDNGLSPGRRQAII